MQSIVELNNIQFNYQPEDASLALGDVFFSIQRGEWVAIIGHSGSGKSTLAKTIDGLLLPIVGTIRIGGKGLNEASVQDIRRMVGMAFQNPGNQFIGSTVEDDVTLDLENQDTPCDEMVERARDALGRVRVLGSTKREPVRLSSGRRQRAAIVGMVALRSDIIILGEVTSMLDPEDRAEAIATIQKIKEENSSIVISITHDIGEAANADRILVMRQGQLTSEGTSERIFSVEEALVGMSLDSPFPEKSKVALKGHGAIVPMSYLIEEGAVN